jgi:hypothetical protein
MSIDSGMTCLLDLPVPLLASGKGNCLMVAQNNPLFHLGQVVGTPAALEALDKAGQQPWQLLVRHVQGDWGDLTAEDRRLNDEAVKDGSRILSAYSLKTGVRKAF